MSNSYYDKRTSEQQSNFGRSSSKEDVATLEPCSVQKPLDDESVEIKKVQNTGRELNMQVTK
jgi:hypothetical protein